MQLAFANERLRRQLLDPRDHDWPSRVHWEDVKQQLADLDAAESLHEVPTGLPPLAELRAEGFDILAGTSVLLSCRVDHYPYRKTAGGRPAWAQINRLMINRWRGVEDADAHER